MSFDTKLATARLRLFTTALKGLSKNGRGPERFLAATSRGTEDESKSTNTTKKLLVFFTFFFPENWSHTRKAVPQHFGTFKFGRRSTPVPNPLETGSLNFKVWRKSTVIGR
jgi:hypothetical protein